MRRRRPTGFWRPMASAPADDSHGVAGSPRSPCDAQSARPGKRLPDRGRCRKGLRSAARAGVLAIRRDAVFPGRTRRNGSHGRGWDSPLRSLLSIVASGDGTYRRGGVLSRASPAPMSPTSRASLSAHGAPRLPGVVILPRRSAQRRRRERSRELTPAADRTPTLKQRPRLSHGWDGRTFCVNRGRSAGPPNRRCSRQSCSLQRDARDNLRRRIRPWFASIRVRALSRSWKS